jgi:hypothetical protein
VFQQANNSALVTLMRKTCRSTYDPQLSSDDIRAFKRLLRSIPGVGQQIKDARLIDVDHARVWSGGSVGGWMVEFVRINGQWQLKEFTHYI